MSKSKQQDPAGPAKKQQSFFQTLLVIFLVLAVGIIFGIGQSSISGALAGKSVVEVYKGVTNVDLQRFARIQTIVSLVQYGMEPHNVDDGMWDNFYNRQFNQMVRNPANELMLARLGEAEGMQPSGKELDAIVDEFLSQEVFGKEKKTMRDGIKEVIAADVKRRSLLPIELKTFLAEMRSAQNYISQYAPNISVNAAAAKAFAHLSNEKISVEEATISTATLIDNYKEAVEADAEALERAYQDIKNDRFVIPRRCHLTCITVNVAEVKEAVAIKDEEISAYYEAEKDKDPSLKKEVIAEQPKELKEGEAPPPPTFETKTLEESKAYIRDTLSARKAEELTQELLNKLTTAFMEDGLVDQDEIAEGKHEDLLKKVAALKITAEDERLSKDIGFTLHMNMGVDDPGNKQTYVLEDKDGKHFARLQIPKPGLFADNVHKDSIFFQTQAFDNADLYVIQIVDDFTPQDYKAFEEVRAELVLYVCAQKAYPELVREAQRIVAAVGGQKDGTLVKWFEQKNEKHWAAQINNQSYSPLKSIKLARAGEEESFNLEQKPLIAYSVPGNELFVSEADNDGDMKRVTLTRVIDYNKEPESTNPDEPPKEVDDGLDAMKQEVMRLTQLDLRNQIEEALKEE